MSVILVVDDDAPTREALATGLKKLGHEIIVAATGVAALDEVRRHEVDLAIIDLRLPDMVGTELFGALRILQPEAIAIMISGHATVDEAVSAIKRGIYDFITKDFRMGELRKVVSKALETQKLLVENERLRQALKERSASGRMMGRSAAFLKIMQTVAQIAPMKSTALLSGESGVGKELIADAIHHQSPRRTKPLVKLNCGALPEGLIESELFGHEKGAFTGAIQQRKGRFELADGGSIFLDEISEMPLAYPGEAAAGAPGRGVRKGRGDPNLEGRRPDHRRHQRGPGGRGGRGAFPQGPLLPPQRHPPHHPAPAGAGGGYPPVGLVFPG